MTQILPRLHFGIFYHAGFGLSRLSVPRTQRRRFGFVPKPCLTGSTVFARRARFTSWFYRRVNFMPFISHHTEPIPSTNPRGSWSCFEQLPLYLCVHCRFRELKKEVNHSVWKGLSYILLTSLTTNFNDSVRIKLVRYYWVLSTLKMNDVEVQVKTGIKAF